MAQMLRAIAVSSLALATTNPAVAGLKNDIIFSSCAAAMRMEYQKADKQLLLSQLNTTCNCVVKKINERKNIEEAKSACINTDQPISKNRSRQTI